MTQKEQALRRLIDHPATSDNERAAARLALARIRKEAPIQDNSFKEVFKRSMKRTRISE